MPTVKPRITITLTEHQHAVLSALAHAQKVSMSSIVVDLVDTTLPVLERLAKVLENAAQAPQSVLDDLRRTMAGAENEMQNSEKSVMEQLDFLVEQSIEAGANTKQRAGAASARPPTSNRGVRNTSPTSKNAHILPMKKGEKNGRAEK